MKIVPLMDVVQRAVTVGLGTTLVAGVVLSASPAQAAENTAGCATGALPGVVLGSPDVKAQQAQGVYLWHGAHGYSLRVTHPGRTRIVVAGVITVSRDVSGLRRVALERADSVTRSNHGRTLAFRFTNYGGVDGIDFGAECSRTVRVALQIAGQPAAPGQVFLGRHRASPTSVPFTIERAHDAQPARVS